MCKEGARGLCQEWSRSSADNTSGDSSIRLRRLRKHTVLYLIAIPILLLMVLPYFYMLMQSLAPWDQVDKVLFPRAFTLRSYEWIWTGGGFVPQPWAAGLVQ